jgi:hypothetical protein
MLSRVCGKRVEMVKAFQHHAGEFEIVTTTGMVPGSITSPGGRKPSLPLPRPFLEEYRAVVVVACRGCTTRALSCDW